jgi:predicted dehydrogenase
MASPISIGIIGCGAIAEEHARALELIEGAKLKAFCDLDPARSARLASLFPGSAAIADPDRIFADPSIDAVYICTHTDSHASLGIRAAMAGKHVMMEKPLALTEAECREVADAVAKSGVRFMTAFKMRFAPAIRKAREFVPHPTLATGQMADVRWPEDFWGNDPVKGGGNVLSQGCHTVDLLCHLVGSEPVRVFAEGGNFHHPGNRIVDTVTATLRFANGAVGSIVQADSGHPPLVSKLSFQLFDGERTAHLHNRLKSVTLWDGAAETRFDEEEETGLLEEDRAFVEALQRGVPPPTGVRDGLRATVVLLRALDSLNSHLPEAIVL